MAPHQHLAAEDLELLALGALDADERNLARSRLHECESCRRDFALAEARIALLGATAPQHVPPPMAKQRLMARIAGVQQANCPALPQNAPQTARSHSLWGWAGFGFAIGLAAASILLWAGNQRLERDLRNMQLQTARLDAQARQNRALLQLFIAQDTQHISLVAAAGQSGQASVEYNAGRGLLLYTGTLPPLMKGRNYQLWIVPTAGNPISAGVFVPEANGRATVLLPPIPKGVPAKAFAVTIEPAGGMPQPTGPKIQIGGVG